MKRSKLKKVALAAAFILMIFLVGYRWDLVSVFRPERIQDILKNVGPLAPIVYMFIMAGAVVISPVPSVPLDVAAGAFFGPLMGTLYSALGALGGAIMSFLIARYLGRGVIERFLTGHINFCTACSDKLLTKIVFLSRLFPFISFDIVSYGAGLTKMSFRNFSLATFLGMLPLTFIYNYFGSVLTIGGGVALIMGLVMVLMFFLFPVLIERHDLFSMHKFFKHTESTNPSCNT